jgi:hypothetical protein
VGGEHGRLRFDEAGNRYVYVQRQVVQVKNCEKWRESAHCMLQFLLSILALTAVIIRLARDMQASISDRAKCQESSSRTMFQKLDFIASRLTSMPKGNRLPVSYAPILQ